MHGDTRLGGSGVATNNCALNEPFTDHADKGDLRLDYQQSPKVPGS